MLFFVLVFLVWIPCGFFAAQTASSKGYSGIAWFFGGFLFGPIALIASAGLGDKKLRQFFRRIGQAQGAIEQSYFSDPEKQNSSNGFLLLKQAEDKEIWEKIIETLKFHEPYLANEADLSKSEIVDASIASPAGKDFILRDSKGSVIAVAYSSESSSQEFFWEVQNKYQAKN